MLITNQFQSFFYMFQFDDGSHYESIHLPRADMSVRKASFSLENQYDSFGMARAGRKGVTMELFA